MPGVEAVARFGSVAAVALRERRRQAQAQAMRRVDRVVVEQVGLDVEDHLVAGQPGAGRVLVERGRGGKVELPARLPLALVVGAGLDGEQGRGRSADRQQELAPAHAEATGVRVALRHGPALRDALERGQRRRIVLAVRHGAEGDGQAGLVVVMPHDGQSPPRS